MKKINLLFANLSLLLILGACKSKDNSPDGFVLHPEFSMELVASEPIVFDPIEMKFNDNGDAFVMEMPGYPMSDTGSRLILLKDENDDGIYDKRFVYADDLGVSTSFLPYRGGFLVASPPDLLWLMDTDKDGVADERKIIISGFSNENLQHNYNSLTYGLDNWIYAANGGNSGNPYFENEPNNRLDLRNGDLRINLEKRQIVRVGESSGGFKITFDEWGHMYETHNMKHISHLVFEDRYTENLPGTPSNALVNISDHEENGTSRIYPIGEQETRVNHPEQSGYFSGACGITYYGGGSFPLEFDSSIFVADCVLNLIHIDMLSKDGSSFKASRKRDQVEFLASKDRSFRPVNITSGPDGALYIIDMYREVIEHPEWIPDELEVNMDLEAGKDKGRIYRITPKENRLLQKTLLSIENPQALVASFNSKNQWERTTAQRLIVTNKLKKAVPYLNEQFKNSKNSLARLHCMWSLEGLNELTISQLQQGLKDGSSDLRENALKISESRLNSNIFLLKDILELTKDEDEGVRMQATLTLSTLENENYRNNSAKISKALTYQLLNFVNDIWSVRTISNAAQRQALNFIQIQLSNNNSPKDSNLQVIEVLAELIGSQANQPETASLIEGLSKNNIGEIASTKIIEALSKGWYESAEIIPKSNSITEIQLALENIEKEADIALISACGKLRQSVGLPVSSKIKTLMENASLSILNDDISTDQRLDYLQLIALDDFNKREQLLYQLLDNKMPLALQKQALIQLKNSNKSTIAPKLLDLWETLGPEARREATNILLYKSYNHDLLLTAMENDQVNLGEFNLDLERRRVLLFSENEDVRKRAEALFSDVGVVKRKDAIEGMLPALTMKGSTMNGKEVFKRVCAVCHVFGDIGVEVGPGLTEISRKSKESMLHDILDPNAGVDVNYLGYKLIAKDGSIYLGLIFKETDEEIGLRMMGGSTKTIKKSNIESLTSSGISLMVEGMEENMTHQEMADLMAFLQASN
jgi:putative membrane-bound dehydrogenase-like protein